MRYLLVVFLILLNTHAMAKIVTFYGTLPEGATLTFERVYSASRWAPGCGRWEHWGLGIPEWVGKIRESEGTADINGNQYTLKIDLSYHKKFCRYSSEGFSLVIHVPQPNGEVLKSSPITITTLNYENHPSIPALKPAYQIECKSEEYGMPDGYGNLRKVDCRNIHRNYLWGEFDINKKTYDEKPIRIDFTTKYIE